MFPSLCLRYSTNPLIRHISADTTSSLCVVREETHNLTACHIYEVHKFYVVKHTLLFSVQCGLQIVLHTHTLVSKPSDFVSPK